MTDVVNPDLMLLLSRSTFALYLSSHNQDRKYIYILLSSLYTRFVRCSHQQVMGPGGAGHTSTGAKQSTSYGRRNLWATCDFKRRTTPYYRWLKMGSPRMTSARRRMQTHTQLYLSLNDRSLSLIIRGAKNNGRKALEILRKHLSSSETRVNGLFTEKRQNRDAYRLCSPRRNSRCVT